MRRHDMIRCARKIERAMTLIECGVPDKARAALEEAAAMLELPADPTNAERQARFKAKKKSNGNNNGNALPSVTQVVAVVEEEVAAEEEGDIAF